MDEDTLDEYGESPLREFSLHVKKLFRRKPAYLASEQDGDLKKKTAGLTAALSFLHTRGMCPLCVRRGFISLCLFPQEFRACLISVSRVMRQVSSLCRGS